MGAEFQAFARLLKAVEQVKQDVLIQPYGVDANTAMGAEWNAQVEPLLMDELIDAYEACLIAQEEVV